MNMGKGKISLVAAKKPIIKKVDTKSNTITICGPCVELPHKYLIIGDLKYSHY